MGFSLYGGQAMVMLKAETRKTRNEAVGDSDARLLMHDTLTSLLNVTARQFAVTDFRACIQHLLIFYIIAAQCDA